MKTQKGNKKMKYKKRTENEMTEIERIRKKFGATRRQFGRIFLGKSEGMVKYYETGKTNQPESVLRLARIWEDFLDKMSNEKK